MTATATDRPPCPIQRLLIFHRKLYEKSHHFTTNKDDDNNNNNNNSKNASQSSSSPSSLGEDASIEELAESILYYHEDRRYHSHQGRGPLYDRDGDDDDEVHDMTGGAGSSSSSNNNNKKKEKKNETQMTAKKNTMVTDAVQFLGLCTALFSLPSVLEGDDGTHDEGRGDRDQEEDHEIDENDDSEGKGKGTGTGKDLTRAVYLSRSTLVFVPLETETSAARADVIRNKKRTPNGDADNDDGDDDDDDEESDILAVVQISRLYPHNNNDGMGGDGENGDGSDGDTASRRNYCGGDQNDGRVGGGHPRAIRRSIEQWHHMFELLYGGGILHRLMTGNATATATATATKPYDNMAQLYKLLKDVRKLRLSYERSKYSRPTSNMKGDDKNNLLYPNADEINRRIIDKQNEIRIWRKKLAIQSIRRDLDVHYKEYLSDYGFIFSRNGGVGRCLVECTPRPIPITVAPFCSDDGRDKHSNSTTKNLRSDSFQSIPSSLTADSKTSLKRSIQEILIRQKKTEEHSSPPIVGLTKVMGVACFHSGDFIDFQTASGRKDGVGTTSTSTRQVESARSLMSFMASHRTKINLASQHRDKISNFGTNNSSMQPQAFGIEDVALSLTSMGIGGSIKKQAKTSVPAGFCQQVKQSTQQLNRGQFLQSPPPSMMSFGRKHTQSILYGDSHTIWAPRVSLPTNDGIHQTNMILFDYLQFSFLIFLEMKTPIDRNVGGAEDSSSIHRDIAKLEEELSEASLLALHSDSSSGTEEGEFIPRPMIRSRRGQSILGIHRSDKKMILILDRSEPYSTSHNVHTRKATHENPASKILRLFKLGGKTTRTDDHRNEVHNQQNHKYTSLEWSALGLDCRHLLASRLPLDACLALDDIIDEARSRMEFSSDDRRSDFNSNYEVCISMPFGWILAVVRDGKEVYICFDSSFVTVADIQAATAAISKQIKDIWIPAM